jgi:hypothetical protein
MGIDWSYRLLTTRLICALSEGRSGCGCVSGPLGLFSCEPCQPSAGRGVGASHLSIPSPCEPGSRKKPSRFGGMEGGFPPTERGFQYINYPNQHRKLITLGVGEWQWRSRVFQRDNSERRSCIARSWCRQVVNASQKPRAEKGWCVVSQDATSRRWVLIRALSAKQIIFSQRPGRPLHSVPKPRARA